MLLEDVVRQVLSAATPSLRGGGKKRHHTNLCVRSSASPNCTSLVIAPVHLAISNAPTARVASGRLR